MGARLPGCQGFLGDSDVQDMSGAGHGEMLKRGDHYADPDLGETPMFRDGQMLILGERPEEAPRQGRDVRHGRGPQTRDEVGRHNKQNYRDEGLLLIPKGKTLRETEAEPREPSSRRELWQGRVVWSREEPDPCTQTPSFRAL